MTILSAAVLLFLVMDPFGNIPFFVAALRGVPEKRRRRIIVRELLIALFVMVVFLFGGQYLLSALQISESALTTAGGTVLFLIAVRMVFPPATGGVSGAEVQGEPFVFPLAIPYVAGPSALASVLLIMNREPARWAEWLLALVMAWFACGLIISCSGFFAKVFGDKVLMAVERLMGMVLVAIAIQMIMRGIAQFASSL